MQIIIPETGFVRLSQVLTVIPLGKTSWWAGVKSGRFPKPVKLSPHCTAWKAEDIHALIEQLRKGSVVKIEDAKQPFDSQKPPA